MEGQFRLDGEDVGQIVRWIGHDAVIFGGNSGGPLVNLAARSWASTRSAWARWAGPFPPTWPARSSRQLIEHGRVSRSWIGLEFQHRLKSDKNPSGVLVAGVVEGSPAARAGIKAGDIVTRFRGQEVNAELPEQMPLINQLVFATPVGETVEVAYLRDGKPQASPR